MILDKFEWDFVKIRENKDSLILLIELTWYEIEPISLKFLNQLTTVCIYIDEK